MREIQININVWNKSTLWGDSIYFCCDAEKWQRNCELTTTPDTFPWWRGMITIPQDKIEKSTLEYKFLVWREQSFSVWENYVGNRKLMANGDLTIFNKFGERSWACPLCGVPVDDEKPVMCNRSQHPMHQECFELYVADELEKKHTDIRCMKCLDLLPDEIWQPSVSTGILQRYNRVRAESLGAVVIRCPRAECDFELIFYDGHPPEDAVCSKCNARWCTNCDRGIDGDNCLVCLNGLRDVAIKIYDALEDVAGIKCPDCFQRGQKLPSECTHITCDCGAVFCYCCGVSGADVDTSDSYASTNIDRLYGHNDDYQSDEKRCPMWLVNYVDLYSDWPGDVEDAQKRFHKMKASTRLKQLKEEIDQGEWDEFMSLDETVKNMVEKYMSKTYTVS